MRFGLFLVGRERVATESVLQALDRQRRSEVPIGSIALREGMLSARQVFDILNYQADSGLRFGELGMRLGHLAPAQVDELLAKQRQTRPFLGQILVDMGAIDSRILAGELEQFKRDARERETMRPGGRTGA